MHRLTRLREVREKGAPAQARRAVELIAALEFDSADSPSMTEADELIEAYLHDPYLTRNDPSTGSTD